MLVVTLRRSWAGQKQAFRSSCIIRRAFCAQSPKDAPAVTDSKSSAPEQGRYDLAKVTNLALVREQVTAIAKLDNYDDLVETYKRDVDLLYSDRFSKGLELKQRLFHARDTHERTENRKFALTSTVAVFVLTLIASGVAMFLYDYDKFVVRFPVYFKYWSRKRRSEQLKGESRVKALIQLCAEYEEKAESLDLINGEIELDLLRATQADAADQNDQQALFSLSAKCLGRIEKHKTVLLQQLDPQIVIRAVSSALNGIQRQPWICQAEREAVKEACFSIALDFHLARKSQPSLFAQLELCSLYTKHRTKGRPYARSAELETALSSLRRELETIGASKRKRARDSAMIKEGVEEYLLRRLA